MGENAEEPGARSPGLAWFDRHVDWPGKSVLDLGCAGGFMAEAMTDKGARVTGIDPAAQAIDSARAHAAETNRDIRYDVGSGEQLPYQNAVFDIVVCVDVLEHVVDLTLVIKQIARVLKPGGVFLFDTINRNFLSRFVVITVAEDILGLLPKGTHDPELFVKPIELRRELKHAGLTAGPSNGLGPRGINRRGDFLFGAIPTQAIIYMGVANKSGGTECRK